MKNKNIIYIICIMLLVICLSFYTILKLKSIDETILNKKWYKYDAKTGYYEVLTISDLSLDYFVPSSVNSISEFDNCKSYSYDKKNKIISMDCGKKIKLIEYNENKLVIEIDSLRKIFYSDVDSSLNYEFNSYFNFSMVEYKKNKIQAIDYIKISSSKLTDLYKSSELSKVIFLGNKCTSVDCVLSLDVVEKWIAVSQDVYYVDSSELSSNELKKLNKLNPLFDSSIDMYNDIYPYVVVVGNNSIVDSYSIKCNGFDCSMFYKK